MKVISPDISSKQMRKYTSHVCVYTQSIELNATKQAVLLLGYLKMYDKNKII